MISCRRSSWLIRRGLCRHVLSFLVLAGIALTSPPTVLAGGSSQVAALISAAEGTYPASRLPTMCVAVSPNKSSPAQSLMLLKKIGATCVRSDMTWSAIEREGAAGLYQWGDADSFWMTMCRAAIKPVMIATYNNPLYAAGVFRPISGGLNIAAYKNFTVAMADHYIGTCPNMAEELFNEPSAINWTTTPWTGTSYAAMLAPVSAAIKAAQPRVQVYSGGIGLDPKEPASWPTQLVSASIRFPAVDAYALHPYYYTTPPPGTPVPEQLLIDAAAFARYTSSTGQAKPIVLTEYGFPLKLADGDVTRQGLYVARGMLAAIIGRYPLHTHYDLVDDGTDEKDSETTYGLFRSGSFIRPYETKPSAVAFASITHAMAKAKSFTIDFDAANSAPSVSFDKGESAIFVIWTYDADGKKSYEQAIGPFKQLSCADVLGKAYPCQFSGGTLSMTLSEAAGPIVVTAVK